MQLKSLLLICVFFSVILSASAKLVLKRDANDFRKRGPFIKRVAEAEPEPQDAYKREDPEPQGYKREAEPEPRYFKREAEPEPRYFKREAEPEPQNYKREAEPGPPSW